MASTSLPGSRGVSVNAPGIHVPGSRFRTPLRNLNRGHLAFTDTPLSIDTLVAKREQFGGALRALFPWRSPGAWVDMALTLLWLAAYHKACFPSAAWVGEQARTRRDTDLEQDWGPASRKSFFRMVAWLEGRQLLVRHGTWRPPSGGERGRPSSNDYDLRGLMRWLARWLREWGMRRRRGLRTMPQMETVGGQLWTKIGGFWQVVGGNGDRSPPGAVAAPG